MTFAAGRENKTKWLLLIKFERLNDSKPDRNQQNLKPFRHSTNTWMTN